MTLYTLVGGPHDGRRIETSGARILRMPVMPPPMSVGGRKVIPLRRPHSDLTIEVAEYERYGDIYWWEGLIRDAEATMDVSTEAIAAAGTAIRYEVRRMLRRQLEGLAPGKALGPIVWRITSGHWRMTVRAIVGPRRVERGTAVRQDRRSA